MQLENGELVVTLGDEETRSGIQILDADHNEECPGAHGESAASNEDSSALVGVGAGEAGDHHVEGLAVRVAVVARDCDGGAFERGRRDHVIGAGAPVHCRGSSCTL